MTYPCLENKPQQTLLNEAYKYANASVAACLLQLFCEHGFLWQRHSCGMSHNQSVLEVMVRHTCAAGISVGCICCCFLHSIHVASQ